MLGAAADQINAVEGALNRLVVIVGKDSIAALPVYDHNKLEVD